VARSVITSILRQIQLNDKVKDDKMVSACCRQKRNAKRVFVGKPENRPLGRHVGGRVILKWILEK
jgi:hypothetical protein